MTNEPEIRAVGTISEIRRVPVGFALAFLGLFLPAVMVTSCDDIVAEASTVDLAIGRDLPLKTSEARESVGADTVEREVEPWAIALIALTAAGGAVVTSGDRRRWVAIPIALGTMVAWSLMTASVSSDLGTRLSDRAVFAFAGGSFVILFGLWTSVVLSLVFVMGEPPRSPFRIAHGVLIVPLALAGTTGIGTPSDDFGGPGWDLAVVAPMAATILTLALAGGIAARREMRRRRAHG